MKNTSLCYIEKDGAYLMIHRVKKKNDVNQDKWVGVGGHFEEGESPEDCMRREVLEETGLTVTKWRYRGIITFVSNEYGTEYMHLFKIMANLSDYQDLNKRYLGLRDVFLFHDETIKFTPIFDAFFNTKASASLDDAFQNCNELRDDIPLEKINKNL